MKKNLPIHEIEEFAFPSTEKFLRRDYKAKKKIDWILLLIIGLSVVVVGMLVFAGIARASSVFISNENKIQAVMKQCEDKVRELSYDR